MLFQLLLLLLCLCWSSRQVLSGPSQISQSTLPIDAFGRRKSALTTRALLLISEELVQDEDVFGRYQTFSHKAEAVPPRGDGRTGLMGTAGVVDGVCVWMCVG